MPTLGWSLTLATLCLVLLSYAPHGAEAWLWAPYSDRWQSHREAAAQPLMYQHRIVLPRNGTSPTFSGNGADGAAFDNWWLKLSGDRVLFTSQKEKASEFGVNTGTQHLCIPQAGRLPRIAIVETRLDVSPLYLLDANFSRGYAPEYEPVTSHSVDSDGAQLACSYGSTTIWSGCGLQLQLGSGQGTDGTLNWSSVTLNAVDIYYQLR